MGYTQNDPFRKYSVGSKKYGTPYYLTTEERDQLYKPIWAKTKTSHKPATYSSSNAT